MSERTKAKLSRRNFLLTVGRRRRRDRRGVVATKTAPPTPTPATNDKRATRGYQATEHVNNYYRTTKV